MLATIFFLADEASAGTPGTQSSPPGGAHRAAVRTLSLAPRTDSGLDRGNYRSGRFRRIDIVGGLSTGDAKSTHGTVVQCEQIRKWRGPTPSGAADCFLVTACEIAGAQTGAFLRQFDAAATYMRSRAGFIRSRLFQSLDDAALFRFINVAQWRAMPDFIEAFSAPAFKALIQGGFDYSSQIIVAGRIATVEKRR